MKWIKTFISKFKNDDVKEVFNVYHMCLENYILQNKFYDRRVITINDLVCLIFTKTDTKSFTLIQSVGKFTLIFGYIPCNIYEVLKQYVPCGILCKVELCNTKLGEK